MRMCRSDPPSVRGLGGIGYGPAFDSSGQVKLTDERGVEESTMLTGMP